jgi:hypothetical protein
MRTPDGPETDPSPDAPASGRASLVGPGALTAAGIVFLALGAVFGAAWASGVESSLLPTGWLFPAVLVASGALMAMRRRFDVVAALWGGIAVVVFVIDALVYMRTIDQGFEDPAAFDATVIVAAFALVALLLRPLFRR